LRKPLLSIVIPSYSLERYKDIKDLLLCIKKQTYTDVETILVVECSTRLFNKISKFIETARIPNVSVLLVSEKRGASFEINLGVKKAKGEIVAILADDTVIPPFWVEKLVKVYMEDTQTVGVTGPILPLWEDNAMKWFPEEFDWIKGCNSYYANTIKRKIKVRSISGSNASFRRWAYEAAGGLLETLGPLSTIRNKWWELGEETELSLRVTRSSGGHIIYNPDLIVYHKIPKQNLCWRFIAQMSFQTGRTKGVLKRVYKKEKHLLTPEHRLLRIILTKTLPNTFIGIFKTPILNLRRFFLTFIALIFVGFGFAAGYLFSSSLIKK